MQYHSDFHGNIQLYNLLWPPLVQASEDFHPFRPEKKMIFLIQAQFTHWPFHVCTGQS